MFRIQDRDCASPSDDDTTDAAGLISVESSVMPLARPKRVRKPKVHFDDEDGLPVTESDAGARSKPVQQTSPQRPLPQAKAQPKTLAKPRPRGRPRKNPLPQPQKELEAAVVEPGEALPDSPQFQAQSQSLGVEHGYSPPLPIYPEFQSEAQSLLQYPDPGEVFPPAFPSQYPLPLEQQYPEPSYIGYSGVRPSIEQHEALHPFVADLQRAGYQGDTYFEQHTDASGESEDDGDDDDDDDESTGSDAGSHDYDESGRLLEHAARTLNIRGVRPVDDVSHLLEAADRDYDEDGSSEQEDEDELSVSEEDEEQAKAGRGRGRGRGRPRGRGRGGRGRGGRKGAVKRAVKEIDKGLGLRGRGRGGRGRGRRKRYADDEDEGTGRSWVKGPRPGTRAPVAPDSEFIAIHAKATQHFIDGEFDRAEELLQAALRLNPEQYSAHSLLAEVYLNTEDKDKAAMSFFMGAYSNHREHNVWRRTGDLLINRIGSDHVDAREFAIYCYRQAVNLDKDDIALRRQRAQLLHLSKYLRKAANDYKIILKSDPCDVDSLQALAEICVKKRWPEEAIPFFQSALPDGHEHGKDHVCGVLDWTHANLLADLQMRAGASLDGLEVVKRFARSLLRRDRETFWDDVADDCEFDAEHEPRRVRVYGFSQGVEPLESYGNGVPIDLRMKMGIIRLRMGPEHLEEALHHFSWFPMDEDAEDYVRENVDIYLRIAGNLYATEHYEEALLYYEVLRFSVVDLANIHLERLAVCFEKCQLFDQAEDIYLSIMETMVNDQLMTEKLAAMWQRAGLSDRADPYTQRLIEYRSKKIRLDHGMDDSSYPKLPSDHAHQDPELDDNEPADEREEEEEEYDDDDAIPLPEGEIPQILQMQLDRAGLAEVERTGHAGKRRRRTARVPVTEHDVEHVAATHAELTACEARETNDETMKDREWLGLANQLMAEFRKQGRLFFPNNPHGRFWGYDKESRQRSQLLAPDQEHLVQYRDRMIREGKHSEVWPVPEDFCGISFERWFRIFLNTALILAKQGKGSKAYDVCKEIASANVFMHDPGRVLATRNVKMLVALAISDDEQVSYVAREYMKDEQFTGDAYRLFIAANHVLPEPNRMWNSSVNQKFVLRQIKALDQIVAPTAERSGYSTSLTRIDRTTGKLAPPPKDLNPELLMLYAQMLYTGGSHTEALNYLHRVHAICPDDALTNLLMGLCYTGWAFKRQSSNRHYLIVQGMAMFDRYREIRIKDGSDLLEQETEFNLGRLFQNLGLLHLSVPCYEKCLEMGMAMKEKMDLDGGGDLDGFTIEAAMALKGIWAINGQVMEAERLMEKYLVL